MDKQAKTKWVKALRSGRYKQGKNYLHDTNENTFCCLGVLCKTQRVHETQRGDFHLLPLDHEDCQTDSQRLPPDILKKIKLTDKQQESLIEMNDDRGWKFKQIADWIEKNL